MLSVVAFHFEAPAIYGGFVGVDIFFVISGYLITGIIQSEIARGSFSFARFYERRVRRLLPALYVMVALSAIPSLHYLLSFGARRVLPLGRPPSSPSPPTSSSGCSPAISIMPRSRSRCCTPGRSRSRSSSIWCCRSSSGACCGWRRRRRWLLPVVLGALALASFALSVILMRNGESANAFFMSPPRAWEFLLGSLVALPGVPPLRPGLAQRSARGLALLLMAIPISSLRPGPGFPGFNALSPCLGAALFIWSGIGVPTPKHGRFVPLKSVQFFGRISYSLYLWHWPLFAFARFSKAGLVLERRREGRAVRADGRDLLSVLALRRAAVPRAALAPTPRAAFGLAACRQRAVAGGSAAGCFIKRPAIGGATARRQRLDAYNDDDVQADLSLRHLLHDRRRPHSARPASRRQPARSMCCCGATAMPRIIITGSPATSMPTPSTSCRRRSRPACRR